jgi:hypothetical protein
MSKSESKEKEDKFECSPIWGVLVDEIKNKSFKYRDPFIPKNVMEVARECSPGSQSGFSKVSYSGPCKVESGGRGEATFIQANLLHLLAFHFKGDSIILLNYIKPRELAIMFQQEATVKTKIILPISKVFGNSIRIQLFREHFVVDSENIFGNGFNPFLVHAIKASGLFAIYEYLRSKWENKELDKNKLDDFCRIVQYLNKTSHSTTTLQRNLTQFVKRLPRFRTFFSAKSVFLSGQYETLRDTLTQLTPQELNQALTDFQTYLGEESTDSFKQIYLDAFKELFPPTTLSTPGTTFGKKTSKEKEKEKGNEEISNSIKFEAN